MARYSWLAIPATLVVAVGIWWSADLLMQPDKPALGPAVVITPSGTPDSTPGDGDSTPSAPPETTPPGDGASTVPPAPPLDAGDDDEDDDDDNDSDDEDDDDD